MMPAAADARERQSVAGQLKSEASGKLPQAEKGTSRDKAAVRLQHPRHGALVPVSDATLARMDALIEHLLELRDLMDGDNDMEPEHHTGAAVFPGHPHYDQTDVLATEGGPGDPGDAEDDDPREDDDPAEEDNEDRCCACDDIQGDLPYAHSIDGPGDPDDAEPYG